MRTIGLAGLAALAAVPAAVVGAPAATRAPPTREQAILTELQSLDESWSGRGTCAGGAERKY